MRKNLLLTAAAVTIATALNGPVSAADLQLKARPAPPPPVTTWAGFYVGAHVGWGQAKFNGGTFNGSTNGGNTTELAFGDSNARGLVLGLHAGYNWQYGQWVFGVEGDATITPGFKQHRCTLTDGPSCTDRFQQSQLDWLSSLRGRLGIAWDRTLIYATGGVAWANVSHKACVTDTCVYIDNKNVTGGVFGGGIEYKINPNFSVRLEGLYYVFNKSETFCVDRCAFDGAVFSQQELRNVGVIRVGASFHPNWY